VTRLDSTRLVLDAMAGIRETTGLFKHECRERATCISRDVIMKAVGTRIILEKLIATRMKQTVDNVEQLSTAPTWLRLPPSPRTSEAVSGWVELD
jgi:hypothetical protein